MKGYRQIAVILLLLAWKILPAQGIEFVENKGQWDTQVKYRGNLNGGAFFLTATGYKVVLSNNDDLMALADYYHGHFNNDTTAAKGNMRLAIPAAPKLTIRQHAYEMKFVGASSQPVIVPDKPLNTVNNYFIGKDSSKWASQCKVFQAVLYKDIYPGVDARYYMEGGSLKYDLIVNPGADPSRIALQFDGADKVEVKNQNLVIKTSVGEIAELKPYTFQARETGRSEVSSKYEIKNNIVKFRLDNYDRSKPLVIDPTLVFSSFAGSTVDNWGYTATYDGEGNFYGGGIVFGAGFPVSNGAFETNFGGGGNEENVGPEDIGIIKLSPNGSRRLYATYLGGNGNEQPHSLVVDANGDLVIAGRTSSDNFPVTAARYGPAGQATIQGSDIFITKINASGTALIGSRLFGGSKDDGVNIRPKYSGTQGAVSIRRNYGDDARSEVIVDAANNIYLASCTQSVDFPVTANAFQQKSGGGTQDGVLIKTNANLSQVLVSSYLGGKADDAAFVIAINPNDNNLYVGGATTSDDFPGTANGPVIYKDFQKGECDGFICIISNNGNTLVKTSYFGTGGNDLVYGVQFDKFGFPYIMGATTGTFTPKNAAFSQPNGKQFIAKLKPGIDALEYLTVFGSGRALPDISPVAFLVDRCENVYVSGWGGGIDKGDNYDNSGTVGLSVTPNAIQKGTDGSDFYFFVLEKNATRQLYGSFFGEQGGLGDHVDGGTSRFDKMGVIYTAICANCQAQNGRGIFPTTPGSWSISNPAKTSAECNLGMVKIAFELAGVGSGVRSAIRGVIRDKVGCIPLRVDFTDTIAVAKKYIWDFGDGSSRVTTTIPSASYTYNNVGVYNVMLIAIDSASCNIADTSYVEIHAKDNKADLSFLAQKIGICTSLEYLFDNTSTAPAALPFNSKSFVWDFGDGVTDTAGIQNVTHKYPSAGVYNVLLSLIDTNYCNYPDTATLKLRVSPNVSAQFAMEPYGCAPYTLQPTNNSAGGQQFYWNFGDGSAESTDDEPTHIYTTPGTYTVTLLVIDSSTCNKRDSVSHTIIISPKPSAAFSYSPTEAKENTPFVFVNGSAGATSYKWLFGDGDSLITVRRDTAVSHIYNSTGKYEVFLIAYNQYGCSDTARAEVSAIVVPLVDVPNAFTPNGDGVNDVVTVKGYGISKLDWRIYNRWGTLIYHANSQKYGWNGKYNGALQPQEVYTYILEVEFTDGKKYQKKGDITLLR